MGSRLAPYRPHPRTHPKLLLTIDPPKNIPKSTAKFIQEMVPNVEPNMGPKKDSKWTHKRTQKGIQKYIETCIGNGSNNDSKQTPQIVLTIDPKMFPNTETGAYIQTWFPNVFHAVEQRVNHVG